ncbi:MAG: hypothetical protein FWD71_20655, partial [Oscillospiraceae bacterium]|nr:hypothetical protein [Oscillospiraceae bacterium]
MPFTKFDRSKIKILPINERKSDIDLSIIMDVDKPTKPFDNPNIDKLADDIINARKKGAPVILMYGAHVIRSGCAKFMIKL